MMMKKVIALAIAGLSASVAFADASNVTIYGVADAYVGNTRAKNGDRITGVQSNGLSESRLGFKGTEDLGNGLKANFKLEFGPLAMDNGTGLDTTRESYVGLSHKQFGSVNLGSMRSPAADWVTRYDALAGSAFSPLNRAAGLGLGIRADDRIDNAVAYASPAIYGVTAQVALSAANEGPTSATRQTVTVASANWENGPLAVGVVSRNANREEGLREYGLGVSYDLKVAKVATTYQRGKSDVADAKSNQLLGVSVDVPVNSRGHVIGGYSYGRVGANKNSVGSYTLAYTHDLSKRTTVYTAVNHDENIAGADGWNTGLGAGLRVKF